jgi:predicted secreted hydrolase
LAALATETAQGPIDQDRPLGFPADHGPHAYAGTELWDLSGLVKDAEGRRIGLRFSILRAGIGPADPAQPRPSAFAAAGIMAAGLGIAPETEPATRRAFRVSRTALGLAGADAADDGGVELWVEDWRLERLANARLQLKAHADGFGVDLEFAPLAAPVAGPGNILPARTARREDGFRLYLEPRLAATGWLTMDGKRRQVSGSAWLNHAWGALGAVAGAGPGRLALNRFELQLKTDAAGAAGQQVPTTLTCIHLRRRSGGGTPIPTCVAIAGDGATRVFRRRDLTLEPLDGRWSSPDRAARYPLVWRLELPALSLRLTIRPLIADQETNLLGRDWSGIGLSDGRDHGL